MFYAKLLIAISIAFSAQRPLGDIATDIERLAQELRQLAPPIVVEAPLVITVPAGGNVQEALDTIGLGGRVELLPGAVYTGNWQWRRAGVATLTTAGFNLPSGQRVTRADLPSMARAFAGNNLTTIDIMPGSSGLTVRGLYIKSTAAQAAILCGHGDSTQTTLAQVPRGFIIEQNFIEGDPLVSTGIRRGIGLHCAEATVRDNWIENIRKPGDESSGIGGWNGPGPYHIVNNYIEAAAQGVFFGGANPSIPCVIPSDIRIEDNEITKRLEWFNQTTTPWTGRGFGTKNAYELKAGQRVMFRRNIVRHVAADGQAGFGIVFTPSGAGECNALEDITVENNVITDVGCAFNVLGKGQNNLTGQTKRLIIRNNYIQTNAPRYACHGWMMQVTGGLNGGFVDGLAIETNTIDMLDGTNLNTRGNQIIMHQGPPLTNVRFVGNLVRRSGAYGFVGRWLDANRMMGDYIYDYFSAPTISGNAFGSFPKPANLPGNLFVPYTTVTYDANGYGTGTFAAYGRQR